MRHRGRASPLPRRRRSPPSRRRFQPWARSRGSRPPTAGGTSSASSSPMPCLPDHPQRPSTSPGIATSRRFRPRWPRPSSSAMAAPPPGDRTGSIRHREPRGCTSGSGTLGLSRVRRASTRITAGRSRWPSASASSKLQTRPSAMRRLHAWRPRSASRSMPTSAARRIRSSSQSIRSSAKVRVCGLPQYEPIRSARSKSDQRRRPSRPRGLRWCARGTTWRLRGSPCKSREVISSLVCVLPAARLTSRFRRTSAFARSRSANALREFFTTRFPSLRSVQMRLLDRRSEGDPARFDRIAEDGSRRRDATTST